MARVGLSHQTEREMITMIIAAGRRGFGSNRGIRAEWDLRWILIAENNHVTICRSISGKYIS